MRMNNEHMYKMKHVNLMQKTKQIITKIKTNTDENILQQTVRRVRNMMELLFSSL